MPHNITYNNIGAHHMASNIFHRTTYMAGCLLSLTLLGACSELNVSNINDQTDPGESITNSVLGQAYSNVTIGPQNNGMQTVELHAVYASTDERDYHITNLPNGWTIEHHAIQGNNRCGWKSCPYTETFTINIPTPAFRKLDDHPQIITLKTKDNRNDRITIQPADIRQAIAYARIHGPDTAPPQ